MPVRNLVSRDRIANVSSASLGKTDEPATLRYQHRSVWLFGIGLVILSAVWGFWPAANAKPVRAASAAAPFADQDRSPVDLVLSPDGAWLATANQTSDSVSLVRVADGQVVSEVSVGRKPNAIVLHPDGEHLLVSCGWSGEMHWLRRNAWNLEPVGKVALRGEPHGIAIDSQGLFAYVALTALDQVAIVDLLQKSVVARLEVGRWPRYLALSPDGQRLVVGVAGERGIAVVDVPTRTLLHTDRFIGLNIGHLKMTADSRYAYFPWMVYRRNPITPGNIRLGWVMASRIARMPLNVPARREAMSLDPPGKAIADPHGLDLTRDEQRLVVSAAGTQELLVYRVSDLPLQAEGSSDHVPAELAADKDRFDRIELGGRPLGLRIGPDDRTVYIANYLLNTVQVVDLQKRALTRSIPLGSASQLTAERRGEAIFHDGRRSLDQWYSCYSCHYEGGTNAVVMDTLNDKSAFTFKSVPALYHLGETGPWTWHGWQVDLVDAMHKSLTDTMQGPEPKLEDQQDLAAYLRTLAPPPNPYRNPDGSLTVEAERGRLLFESSVAGCATCHRGPYFTDGEIHDVGLGKSADRLKGFNTPSLIGVYRKTTLLHDGRASTLEQVLTGPHAPQHVAGTRALTEQERKDLIAYLQSL
jgi:DNA-binding beta-propeller fold protein YncE